MKKIFIILQWTKFDHSRWNNIGAPKIEKVITLYFLYFIFWMGLYISSMLLFFTAPLIGIALVTALFCSWSLTEGKGEPTAMAFKSKGKQKLLLFLT